MEAGKLKGYSFKMTNGQKIITETLLIKEEGKSIVYQATVPDQNEGQTIRFVLNEDSIASYSFENELHDFPKKIQYAKLADNLIFVRVTGQNNEGFSYKMFKIKD